MARSDRNGNGTASEPTLLKSQLRAGFEGLRHPSHAGPVAVSDADARRNSPRGGMPQKRTFPSRVDLCETGEAAGRRIGRFAKQGGDRNVRL